MNSHESVGLEPLISSGHTTRGQCSSMLVSRGSDVEVPGKTGANCRTAEFFTPPLELQ